MSVITTGNHPKALWPGVKAWFGRQYDEHKEEHVDLFDSDTSDKNYEEYVELTGFGLAPVKTEGGSTIYDSESQGYISRLVHVAYSLGYICTKEELDDNLYEVVSKRRARALAYSFRQTKENVAANVYNRAFNASYTGGDGVSLISASHPTVTGNQSNQIAVSADMSEAAIEDLIIQIMDAKNSKGLRINLMPESLHVSRQNWFEANRIMKSVLQSGTANNDINALNATNALPKGIKLNHYFSDADAWFLRTNAPEGMKRIQRVNMAFTQDSDFDTDNAKAKGYERYSFGWGDWRALFGSAGA